MMSSDSSAAASAATDGAAPRAGGGGGGGGESHHDKKDKKVKKDKATRMKEKEAELAQQVTPHSAAQHSTARTQHSTCISHHVSAVAVLACLVGCSQCSAHRERRGGRERSLRSTAQHCTAQHDSNKQLGRHSLPLLTRSLSRCCCARCVVSDGSHGDLSLVCSVYEDQREWLEVGQCDVSAADRGASVWIRARLSTVRAKGKTAFVVLRKGISSVQAVVADGTLGWDKEGIKWSLLRTNSAHRHTWAYAVTLPALFLTLCLFPLLCSGWER